MLNLIVIQESNSHDLSGKSWYKYPISFGMRQKDDNKLISFLEYQQSIINWSINWFNCTAMQGLTDHGSSYNLSLLYEHNLPKSSYNFTYGPFGQVKGEQLKSFSFIQKILKSNKMLLLSPN